MPQRETAEKRFSAGEIIHVQNKSVCPFSGLASYNAEPTWRGAVAGGALIFTHIGGYGSEPHHARPFHLLVFGALGRKTQRAQSGGLCAVAMAKVASLGVGRA